MFIVFVESQLLEHLLHLAISNFSYILDATLLKFSSDQVDDIWWNSCRLFRLKLCNPFIEMIVTLVRVVPEFDMPIISAIIIFMQKLTAKIIPSVSTGYF